MLCDNIQQRVWDSRIQKTQAYELTRAYELVNVSSRELEKMGSGL
jgi:hypothetical protein